ncbi:MAG: hypothetical protein AAFP16_01175 [Pseudomonadota bacterium]
MTHFKTLLALLALIGTAACEEPETYPLSGEECGPNDPVQELNVDNCTPPAQV